jgi:hypothetical protein
MSRHVWYSPSGLVSRILFNLANSIEAAKIPCAVLYGFIEVLGLRETVKILIKLRNQGRK